MKFASAVLCIVFVGTEVSAATSSRLLAVDLNFSSTRLMEVDPSTGAWSQIGIIGLEVVGMAYDANTDILYGIENAGGNDRLIKIDPSTGIPTPIGGTGFGIVTALAFDPVTNRLFGSDTMQDSLIEIDTSTGLGTTIGSYGVPPALTFPQVNGLTFDATGTLFGVDESRDLFLTIDTATGSGTSVGPHGIKTPEGLAFDVATQRFFAIDSFSDSLYEVDVTNGQSTLIGPVGAVGSGPSSLVIIPAVPEPSSMALWGIGSLLFATRPRYRLLPNS